ncbi:unnamed protein product, partial [Rotaria magnacalcarata]
IVPLRNIRWLFSLFIFEQLNVQYARATWPLSNSSGVQLLGLFKDSMNGSESVELSSHFRAMFKATIILSQQHNIRIEEQPITWQTVDTGDPTLSSETPFSADFGEKLGIPVVSYAATDPGLSDRNAYPAFQRTVPSDCASALAVVK